MDAMVSHATTYKNKYTNNNAHLLFLLPQQTKYKNEMNECAYRYVLYRTYVCEQILLKMRHLSRYFYLFDRISTSDACV